MSKFSKNRAFIEGLYQEAILWFIASIGAVLIGIHFAQYIVT